MIERAVGGRGEIALFMVEHFQRLDLTQGVAPMIVDHQIQRRAIRKARGCSMGVSLERSSTRT